MTMRPPVLLLIALLAPSCAGQLRCSGSSKTKTTWPTRVVGHAAGATRLLASPKGRYLLAEVRGRWLGEEYSQDAFVPGVLKLLGPDRGVARFGQGWALGPPDDQGRQWIVEEGPEEYRYRIRRLETSEPAVPLAPPEGFWHVKAALGMPGPAGCMAVALSSPVVGWNSYYKRRDHLWLASFDPETLAPLATRRVEATIPYVDDPYGRGISIGGPAASPVIAWLELPASGARDGRWKVTALDCRTLKTLWQRSLPRPPPPEPIEARRGRAVPVAPRANHPERYADNERMLSTGDLAFTGDGRHLAVLHGSKGLISVSVESVYGFAPATGELTAQLHGKASRFFHAHRLAPVPGRPALVALDLASVRRWVGEYREDVYFGAYEVSLAPARVTQVIDVSRDLGEHWEQIRAMSPRALAVLGREILLAPESYAWMIGQKIPGPWPRGDDRSYERGARRPEVASWVTLPRQWHRAYRPAVKAHDAWMNLAKPKTP